MSDETTTKTMWVSSITIGADNPDEAIQAILRYRKSMLLHSKLLETKSDNEATAQERVNR